MTELNNEMNAETRSGYQVFLENLNKLKIKEYETKMYQIKQRLQDFKTIYYNFKKFPSFDSTTLGMYVNDTKHSEDSLKELKTFLISEEKWPVDKISFIICAKGHIKIIFNF